MDENFFAQLMSENPEAFEQLMGMSGLQDERSSLEQQLAQAEALRAPSRQQFSTGWGAGLSGIGDIIRNIGGGIQAGKHRKALEGVSQQEVESRKMLAQLLANKSQSAPQIPELLRKPVPGEPEGSLFGF